MENFASCGWAVGDLVKSGETTGKLAKISPLD
jgi:hypothetical protein